MPTVCLMGTTFCFRFLLRLFSPRILLFLTTFVILFSAVVAMTVGGSDALAVDNTRFLNTLTVKSNVIGEADVQAPPEPAFADSTESEKPNASVNAGAQKRPNPAFADNAGISCTFYVARGGNDNNTGRTKSEAWASVKTLMSRLKLGETGCVEPGTYVVSDAITISDGSESKPIVVRTTPGARTPALILAANNRSPFLVT